LQNTLALTPVPYGSGICGSGLFLEQGEERTILTMHSDPSEWMCWSIKCLHASTFFGHLSPRFMPSINLVSRLLRNSTSFKSILEVIHSSWARLSLGRMYCCPLVSPAPIHPVVTNKWCNFSNTTPNFYFGVGVDAKGHQLRSTYSSSNRYYPLNTSFNKLADQQRILSPSSKFMP
jgi:hypothetical protein